MKRDFGRSGVVGLLGVLLVLPLAGCRKRAEHREVRVSEGEPVASGEVNPYGAPDPAAGPPAPTSPKTSDEKNSPSGGAAFGEDTRYPVAVAIPGKPGFVFNPYTNGVVDVRGIPPMTLVRDPQDPDKSHTFRLPK